MKGKRKYRHGDVILVEVDKIPAGAVKKGDNVIAEGEATGHAHRIEGGDVFVAGGTMFVGAGSSANLTHEEHKSYESGLAKANYQRLIQREYDDEEEWREVID